MPISSRSSSPGKSTRVGKRGGTQRKAGIGPRHFKPPDVEVPPRVDRLLRRFVVRRFWREQGMGVPHRQGHAHGLTHYEAMRISDGQLLRWTEGIPSDLRRAVVEAVWRQRDLYRQHQREQQDHSKLKPRSGRPPGPITTNRWQLRRVYDLAVQALWEVAPEEPDRARKIADRIVSGLVGWCKIDDAGLISGLCDPGDEYCAIDESRRLCSRLRGAVREALAKNRRGDRSKAVTITHEIATVLLMGASQVSERHLRRVLVETASPVPLPTFLPSGT